MLTLNCYYQETEEENPLKCLMVQGISALDLFIIKQAKKSISENSSDPSVLKSYKYGTYCKAESDEITLNKLFFFIA